MCSFTIEDVGATVLDFTNALRIHWPYKVYLSYCIKYNTLLCYLPVFFFFKSDRFRNSNVSEGILNRTETSKYWTDWFLTKPWRKHTHEAGRRTEIEFAQPCKHTHTLWYWRLVPIQYSREVSVCEQGLVPSFAWDLIELLYSITPCATHTHTHANPTNPS